MRDSTTMAGMGRSLAGAVASAVQTAKNAVTRAFKEMAWSWAGVPSGPLGWISSRWAMPRLHAVLYQVMARELALQPDDDLFEVACGSGVFLADQAAHVRHVAGLDLSGVQIALAQERLADRIAAGTAEVVEGDAAALPWPDATFSVVTCMGSFEAFPAPERVLAESVRVLRPGGRAVFNIGEWTEPGTRTHRVLDAMWVWSEEDVRHMVMQAGFTDVTISYAPSSAGDTKAMKIINRLTGPIGRDLRLVRARKP